MSVPKKKEGLLPTGIKMAGNVAQEKLLSSSNSNASLGKESQSQPTTFQFSKVPIWSERKKRRTILRRNSAIRLTEWRGQGRGGELLSPSVASRLISLKVKNGRGSRNRHPEKVPL